MTLNITHIQGGMREFEITGINLEYLFFNLNGTKQHWRVKIKYKPQQGVLKSKGVLIYEYSFDEQWCRYRNVNDDGNFSKSMEPKIMYSEMGD